MYDFIYSLIYVVPAVLIALCLHELSHGMVSYSLGDPTPKAEGRLSLNPFKHLDLFGTLMLVFFNFGWAKPVSVNPKYYEHPKIDMIKVALAGPIMNFIVGFVAILIIGIMEKVQIPYNLAVKYISTLLYFTALISVGLGLFNLIPIPPLDGSKVLFAILPEKYYFSYMRFEQFGMIILLLFVSVGAFNSFLITGRTAIIDGMSQIVSKLLVLG